MNSAFSSLVHLGPPPLIPQHNPFQRSRSAPIRLPLFSNIGTQPKLQIFHQIYRNAVWLFQITTTTTVPSRISTSTRPFPSGTSPKCPNQLAYRLCMDTVLNSVNRMMILFPNYLQNAGFRVFCCQNCVQKVSFSFSNTVKWRKLKPPAIDGRPLPPLLTTILFIGNGSTFLLVSNVFHRLKTIWCSWRSICGSVLGFCGAFFFNLIYDRFQIRCRSESGTRPKSQTESKFGDDKPSRWARYQFRFPKLKIRVLPCPFPIG